jgi:quinol monooxygenase YgiN
LTTPTLRFGHSDEDYLFKGSGRIAMRFARNVHFQIKSGKETEFNSLFEKEVLPMLRKQNGFQEEVTLVNPKGANFISLWDNRKNAETYETATYPQVLAKLTPFIVGTPRVETFETAISYSRAA